jgi:hypothetical protein
MTTQQVRQKLDRGVALNTLKQRNEQNFKKLGLMNPHFNIKFAYIPKHREDMVVSMFPSEMDYVDGIYLELTNGENYPMYDEPVLYKLRHNPFYKQGEYEIIPADPSRNKNAETYLVPISELELVAGNPKPGFLETLIVKKTPADIKLDKKPIETFSEGEDNHYSELTVRDLAAIFLKTPVSNKKWLNQVINNLK